MPSRRGIGRYRCSRVVNPGEVVVFCWLRGHGTPYILPKHPAPIGIMIAIAETQSRRSLSLPDRGHAYQQLLSSEQAVQDFAVGGVGVMINPAFR